MFEVWSDWLRVGVEAALVGLVRVGVRAALIGLRSGIGLL